MTTGYPAILLLDGRLGVVIGGGKIAARKVQSLRDAGARVRVVAPSITPGLRALDSVEIVMRAYAPGDLSGAAIAIAATGDETVNRAVYEEAVALGIPVNAVDDLAHCTFIAPSIIRRGEMLIAISTGGRGPALAVRLRERIEAMIGEGDAQMLRVLGALRDEECVAGDEDERRERWYRVVDSPEVLTLVRAGRFDDARAAGRALLTAP